MTNFSMYVFVCSNLSSFICACRSLFWPWKELNAITFVSYSSFDLREEKKKFFIFLSVSISHICLIIKRQDYSCQSVPRYITSLIKRSKTLINPFTLFLLLDQSFIYQCVCMSIRWACTVHAWIILKIFFLSFFFLFITATNNVKFIVVEETSKL